MFEAKVTEENFEEEVLKAKGPVLVDFCATWCVTCEIVSTDVTQIAREGEIKVCKVDVNISPELAARFQVKGLPKFVAFRDGQEIGSTMGVQSKEKLKALFD